MPLIDETTEFGQRARRRLDGEAVIWLVTQGKDGAPQPSPVWFVPDGEDEIVLYSQPGTPKLRNIAARPAVALNFNATASGGDVVIFHGEARVDPGTPAAMDNARYIAKYRADGRDTLGGTGMTPAEFSAEYSVAVRVTLTRLRGF